MLQRCAAELSPSKLSTEQSCKFGTIVRALAPNKPAAWLAEKLGCTERGAQYLIDGERKVSARAVLIILAEIVA